MKLGQLNAAIDAAPKVYGRTKFGKIAFEKGSVKAALKAYFDGQRAAETHYCIDAESCLTWEDSVPLW